LFGGIERISNSYALASFVKCGFYFHPSDGDLSLGARLRKKPLHGLFLEYTYLENRYSPHAQVPPDEDDVRRDATAEEQGTRQKLSQNAALVT
jgi:hypothetical protein